MIQLPSIGNGIWVENIPGGWFPIPQKIFAIDDDSCIFFSSSEFDIFGFQARVIDGATQAVTYYQAVRNGNQPNITGIIPFGSGHFVVNMSDGSSYAFQARNLKLNNPSPILIYPGSTVTAAPCYGGAPNKEYYDSAKGIYAAGFYDPNGGATYGPTYASNYAVGAAGLTKIASGYVGRYSNGPTFPPYDPWDFTGGGTSGAANSQNMTNGIAAAYGGNSSWIARILYSVTIGSNTGDCVTPSGAQVTASLRDQIATGGNLGFTSFCDTTFNRFVGAVNSGVGIYLFGDNGVSFFAPFQFTGGRSYGGCVLTRKYVFWTLSFANISVACVPYAAGAAQIYNGSSVTKTSRGLVNFARPVSVIGKYKA